MGGTEVVGGLGVQHIRVLYSSVTLSGALILTMSGNSLVCSTVSAWSRSEPSQRNVPGAKQIAQFLELVYVTDLAVVICNSQQYHLANACSLNASDPGHPIIRHHL